MIVEVDDCSHDEISADVPGVRRCLICEDHVEEYFGEHGDEYRLVSDPKFLRRIYRRTA